MTGWSVGGVTVNSDGGFGRIWEMVAELDESWAGGVRIRIRPGLFDHITTGTSR